MKRPISCRNVRYPKQVRSELDMRSEQACVRTASLLQYREELILVSSSIDFNFDFAKSLLKVG